MAKDRNNMPVRIDGEALKLARIAASYQNKSLAAYVSDALLMTARADIEKGHAELPAPATKARAKKTEGGNS